MTQSITRSVTRLSVLLISLLMCPPFCHALDPALALSQYRHVAWRLQDGLFRGEPLNFAQTKDGYLWVGTRAGLLRFDGIRFVEYPSGPSHVVTLLAASDGALWIGTEDSILKFVNGAFIRYPEVHGRVNNIHEDGERNIWFTLSRTRELPLCKIAKGTLKCFGQKDGLPLNYGEVFANDGRGGFWISGVNKLAHWSPTMHEVITPDGLKGTDNNGIQDLLQMPDGALLVGMARGGKGLGVERLEHGVMRPANIPGEAAETLAVSKLLMDRNQSLWIGSRDAGLLYVHDGHTDHFRDTDGLSSNTIKDLFQDREGNVWVATSKGLDEFTSLPVVPFSAREGLAQDLVGSVAASHMGGVWIGNRGSLSLLRDGRLTTIRPENGLPGIRVTSLLEDHAGTLWVGVENRLYRYIGGKFIEEKRTDGSQSGTIVSLAEDTEHQVWAIATGRPYSIMRQEGEALRALHIAGSDDPDTIAADPDGGVVIAGRTGPSSRTFIRFRSGTATEVARFDKVAYPNNLVPVAGGAIWAATPEGIIFYQQGKANLLTVNNGLPCNQAFSIVQDRSEDFWVSASCGIYKLAKADISAYQQDAAHRFEPGLLDVLDGALMAATDFRPRSALANDGRVWFANDSILSYIWPEQIHADASAPPVHIEELLVDHKLTPIAGRLSLAPLTKDVEIHYTALTLIAPQKLTFRYKLEGHDRDWESVGKRRTAFYNDLRPGHYRFRVIAANGDGIWNDAGDSLEFLLLPAWYQTRWFFVCMVILATVLCVTAYRLRVRALRQEAAARFDERLGERLLLARDLHDTLLQTLQGSKMVIDNALQNRADPEKPYRALTKVSLWLERATDEGRIALNSLRSSTSETNNLAEALRTELEACEAEGFPDTRFAISGEPRAMHPIVRDEIFRIGAEAIQNAFRHSSGTLIEVALTYSERLDLSVKDNGIGIDAKVAQTGAPGHFGIVGMRERAARIDARLEILPHSGSGSEVRLCVPARVISKARPSSWNCRLRSIFRA